MQRQEPAMVSRSSHVYVLSWTLAAVCIGCAGKPEAPATYEEATVNGTVTVAGVPAKSGEVTFDPSNYLRRDAVARTATIGPDGRYTITTLVGQNAVRVTDAYPADALARPAPSEDGEESTEPDRTAGGYDYEELQFEVQSGSNTFNIELGKRPQ
jgi:hypothetical protein